jgi:hypothetical protein
MSLEGQTKEFRKQRKLVEMFEAELAKSAAESKALREELDKWVRECGEKEQEVATVKRAMSVAEAEQKR